MTKILLVMVGGSLGAVSRFGISLLAARLFGNRFPWGTLVVNLIGCFLIGISFALAERSNLMNPLCVFSSSPEAIRLMLERAIKRLPVVDDNGRFKGMISRDSLLRTGFAAS